MLKQVVHTVISLVFKGRIGTGYRATVEENEKNEGGRKKYTNKKFN
jgi:hypothetical protein